jgi:hypothetical protein
VFVAADVLADCIGRQAGDSAEAALMRRVLTADPMTIHVADPPQGMRRDLDICLRPRRGPPCPADPPLHPRQGWSAVNEFRVIFHTHVCPDCGSDDITESEVETSDGITEIP